MDIKISVQGQQALQRVLSQTPKEVQHKVMQDAHVRDAKPLVEREKLLAPEGPTGHLVDSIGSVRIPLKRAAEVGEVHVGPRRRRPYRGYHGHLVEFGTRPRRLKGRGQYPAGTFRGVMPSKPFVRPAFEQTRSQVIGNMHTNLMKRLVARMRKELGSQFIK